jgi:hypothetical protein
LREKLLKTIGAKEDGNVGRTGCLSGPHLWFRPIRQARRSPVSSASPAGRLQLT